MTVLSHVGVWEVFVIKILFYKKRLQGEEFLVAFINEFLNKNDNFI